MMSLCARLRPRRNGAESGQAVAPLSPHEIVGETDGPAIRAAFLKAGAVDPSSNRP
jgi:hypothetical protein